MKTLFSDPAGAVHLLEGDVGGRPLMLVYLRGRDASLLWDTGCAGDPARFILPQIAQAGGDPAALTWIVNSHTDLDHTGGNAEMKAAAPRALLAAGDADREAAASPDVLFARRYNAYEAAHGIAYDEAARTGIRAASGAGHPLDLTFTSGEQITLSYPAGGDPGWSVRVEALPGHAHGHLGLYDAAHQALYGGDALHGAVYLGLDGTPKLCPTYLHVEEYLSTIARVEARADVHAPAPITTYVGCHWPVAHGADAVRAFCIESRAFVEQAEAAILDVLAGAAAPVSLRALIEACGPRLGSWPRALDIELVFAFNGHMNRLTRLGRVRAHHAPGKVTTYAHA